MFGIVEIERIVEGCLIEENVVSNCVCCAKVSIGHMIQHKTIMKLLDIDVLTVTAIET